MRWFRAALLGTALLSGCAPSTPPAPTPTALPGPVVDAATYGAVGDGVTDTTLALRKAIAAAQAAGGGSVLIPKGRYLLSLEESGSAASLLLDHGPPITIAGASRDSTVLIEANPGRNLLGIRIDGVTVQDITLDTQTHQARAAINVVANRTVLRRARVLGSRNVFALYFAGPAGARALSPLYNTGNQVLDTDINDQVADDGFSWSFQQDSIIRNITETGSRLALYIDRNVLVDNYHFTPGVQAPSSQNGFFITEPSDAITIHDFVSDGQAGVIGPDGHHQGRRGTRIIITGEKAYGVKAMLRVGDVSELAITGSSFPAGGGLLFDPAVAAESVTVSNTTLGRVQFSADPTARLPDIAFTDDTFLRVPGSLVSRATFSDTTGVAVALSVTGGTWSNAPNPLMSGTGITPQITGLRGYD